MKSFAVSILALPFALTAFLSACTTTKATQMVHNDARDMAIGQTAYADGPKIRIVRILEDSRCPINARCIRAGDVKLQMLWIAPSGNKPFEISSAKPATLADGMLTLTDVRPGRVAGSGKEMKPADYRFSFSFEGGL